MMLTRIPGEGFDLFDWRRIVTFSLSLLLWLMAAGALISPSFSQSTGAATVIVTITGLPSAQGQVKLAMFNSADSWLGDQPRLKATLDVQAQTISWKVTDIPFGEYGVAVFHDENKNGKMDKNFIGIPQEAYGFSNNQRVTFGPPKWEKAKFIVQSALREIVIEIK